MSSISLSVNAPNQDTGPRIICDIGGIPCQKISHNLPDGVVALFPQHRRRAGALPYSRYAPCAPRHSRTQYSTEFYNEKYYQKTKAKLRKSALYGQIKAGVIRTHHRQSKA